MGITTNMTYLKTALCATAGALMFASAAMADPLASPAMTGPVLANPNPISVDAGPLGQVYVSGVVSGVAMAQSNPAFGDHKTQADISNGQVVIQTTEGPIQFYVQAGIYSLPSLGLGYMKSDKITDATFGAVPNAYVKIVPSDNVSVMIGKLPTLVGAEYTFTFQNMNIVRGLLWNQEPAVSQGVQFNFASGPISASVAWTDGYYSEKANWISGLLTYTVSPSDSVSVVAAASTSDNSHSSFATSPLLNNSEIYNLLYTHNSGGLTITPYLQYSRVSEDAGLGIPADSATFGAAVLGKYAFSDEFSLAARAEYIKSTGSVAKGTPNLLYGPGSKAWSLTVTPTYQKGVFFLRGEASYVQVLDSTPGFALGDSGTDKSQFRAIAEAGFVF